MTQMPPTSAGAVDAVCVDGGNSKTDVVLIARDGTVLGQARGGASGHQMVGLETAMTNLRATTVAAFANGGLEMTTPEVGIFCLAGLDLPIDDTVVGSAVNELALSAVAHVMNDTFAIMRAGATTASAVAVVCGTGLNCVAQRADGVSIRYASLGELSGDYAAGGAWLGMRTLGVALRGEDERGEETTLSHLVAQRFERASAHEVLEGIYSGTIGYDQLPPLAELALRAAADGDHAARVIVDQLADEACLMAVSAIRRLRLQTKPIEVVVGGGIFASGDAGFFDRFWSGVTAVAPKATARHLGAAPVLGAALLALDAMGANSDAAERLAATLRPN